MGESGLSRPAGRRAGRPRPRRLLWKGKTNSFAYCRKLSIALGKAVGDPEERFCVHLARLWADSQPSYLSSGFLEALGGRKGPRRISLFNPVSLYE